MRKVGDEFIVDMIPKEEVLVKSYDEAVALSKILIDNEYVVMISQEEGSYVVNWIWSEGSSKEADRNDVVFMPRGDFEAMRFGEAVLPHEVGLY